VQAKSSVVTEVLKELDNLLVRMNSGDHPEVEHVHCSVVTCEADEHTGKYRQRVQTCADAGVGKFVVALQERRANYVASKASENKFQSLFQELTVVASRVYLQDKGPLSLQNLLQEKVAGEWPNDLEWHVPSPLLLADAIVLSLVRDQLREIFLGETDLNALSARDLESRFKGF